MLCVLVKFVVAADQFDWMVARTARQAADSLEREPGCRTFEVWWACDVPTTLVLYEVYGSRADFDAHLASTHFAAFDAEVKSVVISKTVDLFDRRAAPDQSPAMEPAP